MQSFLNVALADELVHQLLLVVRQVPLRKALVAFATSALLVKHGLKVEVEVSVEDGAFILTVLMRRVKGWLQLGYGLEGQLLLVQLAHID